jgi:hypothetical protein
LQNGIWVFWFFFFFFGVSAASWKLFSSFWLCMYVCVWGLFSFFFFSMLELVFVLSSSNRWGFVVCCLWGGFWSCGYFIYERVLLALRQGLLLLFSLSCTFFVSLSCGVCSSWQKR